MLTLYRASAGSGKTYKLTEAFLNLLFNNPGGFKRILAVTFTNKATEEMKTRIVMELYALADGEKSGYLEGLMKRFDRTELSIRSEAKEILIDVLHDYSSFNISTIDRFFQQTMRAFTREIGLQGGYGLEMDERMVLTEAVEMMLNDLQKPENKNLLDWLIRFTTDKVENGDSWELRKDILGLSQEIFKESFKEYADKVNEDTAQKETLQNYKAKLDGIVKEFEAKVKQLGEKGVSLLDQYGLKFSDFKGGSRSPFGYFDKLASGDWKEPTATFCNLVDTLDNWSAAKAATEIKSQIESAYHGGLNDCVRQIVDLFSNRADYLSAVSILRFYYVLAILSDVSKQVSAYRQEKNIMLISDTNELLNKVIDESDAPFIYEKTGVNIDNFMIDEFQDTSSMQWSNFRPLIKNSLAEDRFNLIVGDVKQSIYRFRNSDWTLLDTQIAKDFVSEGIEEQVLEDNWRSCKCIVDFNNAFFALSSRILQGEFNLGMEESTLNEDQQDEMSHKLTKAYGKLYQNVAPPFLSQDGHVKVHFIEEEEVSWKEAALDLMIESLQKLQQDGYRLSDIAVLVRTNSEASLVANKLLEYKKENPDSPERYEFISDEALFIGSAASVRFMISLLRYLNKPDDETLYKLAVMEHLRLEQQNKTITDLADVFAEENVHFDGSVDAELQRLQTESLYEMIEGLVALFAPAIPDNEQPFVQALLDMIMDYMNRESGDLARFLKWWDDFGYRKTIVTPDAQDAIRIMTVHKSKGLGFRAVVMPFTDWEIESKGHKAPILWCKPSKAPFNELTLVPIKYTKDLIKTIFAMDYYHEKLHAYIDNLNTLYVAFTRAKDEMILFAPKAKKDGINSIASLMESVFNMASALPSKTLEDDEIVNLGDYWDEEQATFEYGDWWHPKYKQGETKTVQEIEMKRIESIDLGDRLSLRLQDRDILIGDEQLKYGKLMHEILGEITTQEDIEAAVERMIIAGVITSEEGIRLCELLQKHISKPEVKHWFDGSLKVLNEIEILSVDDFAKRPDRVMIDQGNQVIVVDYKFGHIKDKLYHYQVRNYVKLIKQMGFKNVKGYLWYIELNQIEQVR